VWPFSVPAVSVQHSAIRNGRKLVGRASVPARKIVMRFAQSTHNHTSPRSLWQADKRFHKKHFAF
jgi:hypothetical protein